MTREEEIKEQAKIAKREFLARHNWSGNQETGFQEGAKWADQHPKNNIVEQLTAFAQHLNKRGAFRDDLCMDFEYEAQSFIEMQTPKEL